MLEAVDLSSQDPILELLESATELHSLPDIYFRVRDIVNDPESELNQLSEVLSTDPGLTARLLKVANSPIFALVSKIDTISRAVQVVGFQHIYDMVIATSIAKAFHGADSQVMTMDAFWMKSIERALITKALSERMKISDCERMFVAGLLLDIGHLVLYEAKPEEALRAIEMAATENTPLVVAEREILGFTAAELGSALAREWNFPDQFSHLIFYQDCPENAQENQIESAIVHIANRLAGTVNEPEALALSLATMSGHAKQTLGLEADHYAEVLAQALEGISSTLELIIP